MLNNKKKKLFLSISVFSLAICGAVLLSSNSSIGKFLHADSICEHEGNHYLERVATFTESGTKEYWVCCKCHEHFLEEVSGNWTDVGVASEVCSEDDDRYIEPGYKSQTISEAGGSWDESWFKK